MKKVLKAIGDKVEQFLGKNKVTDDANVTSRQEGSKLIIEVDLKKENAARVSRQGGADPVDSKKYKEMMGH